MKKSIVNLLVGFASLFLATHTCAAAEVIVPSITVLTPKGGEIWRIGSTNTISWSSQQFGSSAEIAIILSPNPVTGTAYLIARGISNTGSFSWNTGVVGEGGTLLMPSGTYTIQISAFEEGKSSDYSGGAFFTITPPLSLKNFRFIAGNADFPDPKFQLEALGLVKGSRYRIDRSTDLREWKLFALFDADDVDPDVENTLLTFGSVTAMGDSVVPQDPVQFFRAVEVSKE